MVAQTELQPNVEQIAAHLRHITRRWSELGQPVMLETVMLTDDDSAVVKDVRHYQPTPEGIAEAAQHLAEMNKYHLNAYAVVNPLDATNMPKPGKRANKDHIVASFFHWADADSAEAAENIRRLISPRSTFYVLTGTQPCLRPHVYWELEDPSRNLPAWEAVQYSISRALKTDDVSDAPRIMRLAGTINWPKPKKLAKGYIAEATTLKIYAEDERPRVTSEQMARAFPHVDRTTKRQTAEGAPFIDTGMFEGRTVEDYAEMLRQAKTDGEKHYGVRGMTSAMAGAGVPRPFAEAMVRVACPVWDDNIESLFDSAYAKFFKPGGKDPFEHEKAEQEKPQKEEWESDASDGDAPKNEPRDLAPADLWGVFPAPALPRGLLPKVIEDFALIQAEQMGADAGGLAAAALCVCCAAIPDDIRVKVKRYDDWHESARIWVALVGDPSTRKSPILSAAERPLRAIDGALYRDFIRRKGDYDALKKDEKAEAERPRQTRKRLEDTTIEAAQEVMADSPQGVLVVQDELSGWFGGMDRYSNGKGRDRSFWLQAFNGGVYAYNRVGRGAGMVENLSACVLGGIQPEPIRGIVADAHDDGLVQRLFPIVLTAAKLGSEDAPPTDAARAYAELVAALGRVEIDAGAFRIATGIDGNRQPAMTFSDGAQRIRRELEIKHLDLMSVECVSRKLASHIGKYDGLFARLCVAFHAADHAAQGMIPAVISEATARRVADFLHRFLLRHAMAFYNGVLNLSDDHDRLTALAGYILAHRLEMVSTRDVARGDGTMRKLTRQDVVRLFEQLEALGWVSQQPTAARVNASPVWVVNPVVHELFAERAEAELKRRKETAARMAQARRETRGGDNA